MSTVCQRGRLVRGVGDWGQEGAYDIGARFVPAASTDPKQPMLTRWLRSLDSVRRLPGRQMLIDHDDPNIEGAKNLWRYHVRGWVPFWLCIAGLAGIWAVGVGVDHLIDLGAPARSRSVRPWPRSWPTRSKALSQRSGHPARLQSPHDRLLAFRPRLVRLATRAELPEARQSLDVLRAGTVPEQARELDPSRLSSPGIKPPARLSLLRADRRVATPCR